MNKCLITKLNGIVNNENLLKIGEFRIKIDKVQTPSTSNRSLAIGVNIPTNIRIIGSGYFTDENLSADKGKSLLLNPKSLNYIYVSNDDITISIENKYNLTRFNCNAVQNPWDVGMNHANIHINIEDFKYSTALTGLGLSSTSVSGDIAAVKNLTALTSLVLNSTSVSGDIAAVKNLTALTGLGLSSTSVSGDIAAVKNLTALTGLILSSTSVSGDIAAVKNLTALTSLALSSTSVSGDIAAVKNLTALTGLALSSTSVSGDIAAVKNLTALTSLNTRFSNVNGDISNINSLSKLKFCQLNSVAGDITVINNTMLNSIIISNSGDLTGDIAKLKSDFKYLGLDNDSTSRFTWSSRDSSSIIFGNGGTPTLTSNLDDMLTNMAQCRNGITSSSNSWEKVIEYQGNRTSASDAAVEKLQSYGYTVKINKV